MDLEFEHTTSQGNLLLSQEATLQQLMHVTAVTTTAKCPHQEPLLMSSMIVPDCKSSIGEESEYVIGTGSLALVSSSIADDDEQDDGDSDSVDSYATQNSVEVPATDVVDLASSSTVGRRPEMLKKKSCPTPTLNGGFGEDDGFQRLALSDDETSGTSGLHHSVAGNRLAGMGQSKLVPTNIPSYAMLPVTGSNRRRLGQRRSNATTHNDGADTNVGSAHGTGHFDEKQAKDSSAVKFTVSNSPDLQQRKMVRKPSSLFYLDYIDENEDDEEDDNETVESNNFSNSSNCRFLVGGAGMSSSRKMSAAAYASLVPFYAPDEDDEDPNNDVEDEAQDHQGNEHIKRHRIHHSRPKRSLNVEDYEHNLQQIDQLTKVFRLSDDVYKRIKALLHTDMDRGLQLATHNTATVKMFHTHVRTLPNGTEKGRYLALDLGGTNFRVLLVDLEGSQPPKVNSKVYLIPLRIMLGSGEQLFDHIVKCIAEFLEMHGLEGERFMLGFTFSFPCIQEGLASARLARWTKGFKCSGVENEDVVKLLHDAIARKENLDIQCVAIINDNVGALMTGAHGDNKCRVGLIIGTGTNCCYLEDIDKVELWKGDIEEPRKMVVNTEWGAFGDDGVLDFVRNPFDRRLDVTSLNPGNQLFEKMISGMYMGEIVRLVLCELTLRGLIFRRRDSDQLFEQQRFFTKYISEIESDDPDGDYPNTRIVLEELVKSHPSREECQYVQHVCWQVSQRAAFLAATAVAVVIERLNLDDVTVAVDGSLYRFHPHFKDLMNSKIAQLVGLQQKFKLILAHDGSGQGAALVAALADKARKQHNDSSNNGNTIIKMY